MKKKPNEGQVVLAWTGTWEWASYRKGTFWGAHHSSDTGNELYDVEVWMEQPPAPKESNK